MKPFSFILAMFLFLSYACDGEPEDCVTIPWPDSLPVYDHVVIVVEENKDYNLIIGADSVAPYINGTLRAHGANFTRAYGEEHHSQGNYFWLFSGDNQGVGYKDRIPTKKNNKHYPFRSSNLGEQLIEKGYSFKGYAQSLPSIGSEIHNDYLYARKHVPWISFANVPNGTTFATSSNLPFSRFPADSSGFKELPTVAFVIPDLDHDMHNNYRPPQNSITMGDIWLEDNLDAYYQWARDNNSLLILTFDENSDSLSDTGLTDPASDTTSIKNQIVTIFAGAHIKQGEYREGQGITHVNILRTLEAMYGLCKSGAQQKHALAYGITDDYIITDVFKTSP